MNLKDKEEVISEIRSAFEGVTLNGGVSLQQARVMDNFGRGVTAEEFAHLPEREITEDWSAVPIDLLEGFDCVAFLDEKGLRYYLPAFMLHILDNYDSSSMMTIGTLSALYPRNESQEHNLKELDQRQRCAVSIFLKSLPELVDLWGEDVPIVERAYSKYWFKFLVSE